MFWSDLYQVRWGDKTAPATWSSYIFIVPEADGTQGDSYFNILIV